MRRNHAPGNTMSTRESLDDRRSEFESHVWNHAEDAFQMSFDERAPLTASQFVIVQLIVEDLRNQRTDEEIADRVRREMQKNTSAIMMLMQIVGLTRNKILQDLRGSLAGSSVRVPSSAVHLHRKNSVWKLAGPYLAKRLRTVLTPVSSLPCDKVYSAVESLNQATWPGWIRQERAKRSGHEAEHRLANLFANIGLPFSPKQKAKNPLCRDAQINGISYDLVIPSESNPLLCFKATVHTSNIGQYGESKDALEIAEARASLAKLASRPLLMALIDGVGFRSNRAGLDGVLEGADEFCQFATLWKAAVVAAGRFGNRISLVLPDADRHTEFLQRHDYAVDILDKLARDRTYFRAGEAQVSLIL